MIEFDSSLSLQTLRERFSDFWAISATKIRSLQESWDNTQGAPVFTIDGKYQSQGWTDWTRGFQVGSAILQFDATDDEEFLAMGRDATIGHMAEHLTHVGVHDHGFNNVSTYGNLWRLMREGRLPANQREQDFYEVALKVSGAVQASRWSTARSDVTLPGETADEARFFQQWATGFIHSFNGPHSLFSDTIRSLRALALSHMLGHALCAENDERISLLDRLVRHAATTARYNVYYGAGRDTYDVNGRVAHESLFNATDGRYRCASTQQGYSPFTTWTRGLAWILTGYAELLEFLETCDDEVLASVGGRGDLVHMMKKVAIATADFYIESSPADGIPYWDTGAPGLVHLENHRSGPSDPHNDHEPVDSSAAAISAQGILRLALFLDRQGDERARTYWQAGLRAVDGLLGPKYLSEDPNHQGLLLHSIYHRPRGWDHTPDGSSIPCGESCQWGDYHLRELILYLERLSGDRAYHSFCGWSPSDHGGAALPDWM